jgi:hypothetical protein
MIDGGRLHLSAAALALSLLATGAQAQTNCTTINDDQQRLACFDAPVKKTNGSVQVQQRKLLARGLEQSLLKIGVSADVYIEHPQTPLLGIYAHLDKSSVYQIITATDLLRASRAIGFHKVDFFDKGSNGHWTYDLTKGVPTCDIYGRLCL